MSIPIQLGSAATKGEGRQSILCAYLAGALLGNAIVGAWWLDAVVGLLIAAVAIKEGREAWRGEGCCVNSPLDGTGFTDDGCGDDCCKQTTEAIPPSCSLDPDALRAQLDRYATIGKTVLSTKRSPSSFVLQLSPEADPGLLVEETLRIESACCTFFRLAFDSDRHLLTIAVDRGDVPALDAIASARSASDNWRSLRLDSRLCFGLPGEPTFWVRQTILRS